MDEIFKYMGYKSNCRLFIHYQNNQMKMRYIEQMQCDIYNMMIHEKLINLDDNVIIFNTITRDKLIDDQMIENYEIVVGIISHSLMKRINITDEQLIDYLIDANKLVINNKETHLTIKCIMMENIPYKYESYIIPSTDKDILETIPIHKNFVEYYEKHRDKLKISKNRIDLMTVKPIPYLNIGTSSVIGCEYCYKACENMGKCGRCKIVKYCSRECQIKH